MTAWSTADNTASWLERTEMRNGGVGEANHRDLSNKDRLLQVSPETRLIEKNELA